MTAEERAIGEARLRNKLLTTKQELAILTDQATELSELFTSTAFIILNRPATLQLAETQITKISEVQKLANRIKSLEAREAELKEKVGNFS